MIHYALRCGAGHAFDGWFRDSGAFEAQVASGLVTCPDCGDAKVVRGLMAPAIPRKGAKPKAAPPQEVVAAAPETTAPQTTGPETTATGLPDQMRAVLQRIRAEVERTSDYVGPAFADEARRIHRGDTGKRNIHGESTPEQAEALAEEGIEVAQIPWVPRADS